MLKATIDSSILNSFSKEGLEPATDYPFTPQLTILLTGLHWEDEIPEKLKVEKLASKVLFPWNWEAPLKIRIYWLMKEGDGYSWLPDGNNKPMYSEITTETPKKDGYEDDIKILNEYFSETLNNVIWKENLFNDNQILWFKDEKKNVVVNDDFETNNKDFTGFLKSAVGQFAQKLSPLNQFLDLVFFSRNEEVKIPDKAKYYVAFPVGGEWWNIDTNRPLPEPTTGSFRGDFCYLNYSPKPMIEISNGEQAMFKVKSPITALEAKKYQNDSPIQLRDDKGNFKGTVEIKAFDIDDWTDTLLDGLAVHFDLPALMLQFVKEKEISNKQILERINDFLWTTVRDSLGFGYRISSEGTSILRAVVKQYCDDTAIKELYNLSAKEQTEYWKKYDDTIKDLDAKFRLKEKSDFNSIALWIKFLKDELDKIIESKDFELRVKELIIELVTLVKGEINNTDFVPHWQNILKILNDGSVQALIVSLQWQKIDQVNNIVKEWLDKLMKDGKITDDKYFLYNELGKVGELKHQEQYAIVNDSKNSIVDNTNQVITEIVEKSIKAVIDYADNRLSQNKYYPTITDPLLPTISSIQPTWNDFKIFIEENLKTISDNSATGKVEDTVNTCIKKPFEIPPSVFLKVDSHDKVQRVGTKPDSDEDLNDEIAGHIVLMQRGEGIGSSDFKKDWRYLNRVKVSVESLDKNHNKVDEGQFDNKYIIPAFVPEFEDEKRPYLELRNERLSLIAGHETFNDSKQENDKPGEKHIVYDFVKKKNDTDHEPTYPAYAFWYGYNYKFAGFVTLNSGVLPKAIRDKEAIWNIPKEGEISDSDAFNHATSYHHLRRVPVSKVRVEPVGKVLSPPQGLLPLAFELPEWKGDNIIKEEKGKDFEQTHYLLAEGSLSQKEITLELKKPTTSFWNWYAWMGEESNINEGDKGTLAYQALTKELEARDALANSKDREKNILCDPAVENILYIKIDKLFPIKEESKFAYPIKLNKNKVDTDNKLNDYLSEFENSLPITLLDKEGDTEAELDDQKKFIKSIKIKKGDVIRITIHSLIKIEHFENGNKKFHSWMDDVITYNKKETVNVDSKNYYLSQPNELWFEAAIPLAVQNDKTKKIEKELFKSIELWESIDLNQTADKINCSLIKTTDNYNKLAYASRIEVKHQIWNWNGRLDSSEKLIEKNKDGSNDLDPKNKKTTNAMKWEAWAFSDRPDYSALVQDVNLLASRDFVNDENKKPLPQKQILFTDHRPNEEKALYYRFTAIAHSRYEKLGVHYQIPVEAKIGVMDEGMLQPVDNIWKRYLRKSSKTKQLPKPSIRFVIPLTRSIQECNEKETYDNTKISAAALLIVLNDHWFTEAGLAEQLEVGIDVLKNPKGDDQYIQAGNDPILTGNSLSQVEPSLLNPANNNTDSHIEKNGDHHVALFKPKGPAGLTFEPQMQTPLVSGSSFIMNIPDVKDLLQSSNGKTIENKMKAWAMMQIAVRRTLREELCEKDISVEALRSGWTAKEWVQFLPAVDSFIPKLWREKVRKENTLSLNFTADNIIFLTDKEAELPVFDTTFEERTQRFLVLTETVYDIGGQPCESYKATIKCNRDSKGIFTFGLNHPKKEDVDLTKLQEGYLRIILVRVDMHKKDSETETTDIWSRLFGENTTTKADMNLIQNDPSAALPLISERIPFKNKNQ